MNRKWILLIMVIALLTACSKKESAEDEVPKMLDIDFTVTPEKVKAGENITFEAAVTYGDEKVEDADEVKFEIWRSQSENHEKIIIEHSEDGIYKLDKSFTEEGTYYVYAHVTARSMHGMPKKEFVVGQPSAPEEEGGSHEMQDEDSEETEKETSTSHGH